MATEEVFLEENSHGYVLAKLVNRESRVSPKRTVLGINYVRNTNSVFEGASSFFLSKPFGRQGSVK